MTNSKLTNLLIALFLSLGIGAVHAGIEPTSGRYIHTETDLSIKVVGGQVTWQREWRNERWQFNRRWTDLEIEHNASDGSIHRITRNNDVYEPTGSSGTRFKFGPTMRIRTTDEGFRWYDRQGNWVDYDQAGRILGYGERNGVTVTLTRDAEGRLDQVLDHHGEVVLTIEHAGDRLVAVEDSTGRRVEYAYEDDRLSSVTDARGHPWTYQYNSSGQLTGLSDPLERETIIIYTSDNRVRSIEHPGQGTTEYKFDYLNAQRLFFLRTTRPGGQVIEAWYDRKGELVRRDVNGQTVKRIEKDGRRRVHFDFNGHATVHHFDEFKNPTGITWPDGTQTVVEYEHNFSQPIREIDEASVVTRYEYDSRGNRIRTIEAEETSVERVTEYDYDALGRLEAIRRLGDDDTQTAETTFEYDDKGNLTQITGPEDGTETRAHDVMGNVLTRTDALERTWTYTYDEAGNLTAETNPEDETTAYTYDALSNRTKVVHPDQTETEMVYDDADRLVKVIDAAGGEQIYEYDDAGNRTRETDPSGKVTDYSYDADRRLEKITDGAGNETIFHYPGEPGSGQGDRHQPIEIEYPTFERHLTYDRRGWVIAQTDRWLEDAQWREQTTRTTYDARGQQIATEGPTGRTTEFAYDALGRMTTTTDALDQTTRYHYDNRDNLIGLTDANDNTHVFSFDRADRMTTEARPMGQTIVYAYDTAGQLTTRTDPVGNRAEYDYDKAGRRAEVRHYPADAPETPERVVTFSHDERGRMTGYDDGVMSGSYGYDALGRKTSETVDYSDFRKTHQQTWHANGRQKSLTAPDGTEYGFSWDEANRMQSVTIPGEGVIAYSEYEWQQPSTVQYPRGTTRENTYDGLQRHKTIQVTDDGGQVLMDYQYTWDETGNVTEKATEHGIYSYGYDEVNRLTDAEYPTFSAEEWTYDPLGNRLTDTGTGEEQWQYNDNNELLDSVDYTHEYDDNGSLVTERHPDGALYRTFEYNAENRMSAVKHANGDLIAEYLYDPFGRRVKKTVYDPPGQNPETTWYVYSDQGLMAELDGVGNPAEYYLFPPDGLWSTNPVLRKSGSSYYYYQTDHLGTPQQLIDAAGAIAHSREMRAFGELAEIGMEDRWRFAGQVKNVETGQYYNYHRDYAPALGRYVQSDPIGPRDGANVYTYVGNQAIRFIDPRGLTGQWPNPDYSDSCKTCEYSEEEIKDSVKRACEQAMKDIRDERLKNCIRNQCVNGEVVCSADHEKCKGSHGWSNIGKPRRANICVSREYEVDEIGRTTIHEWCHLCKPKMPHGDVRDPGLYFNLEWSRSGCPI